MEISHAETSIVVVPSFKSLDLISCTYSVEDKRLNSYFHKRWETWRFSHNFSLLLEISLLINYLWNYRSFAANGGHSNRWPSFRWKYRSSGLLISEYGSSPKLNNSQSRTPYDHLKVMKILIHILRKHQFNYFPILIRFENGCESFKKKSFW